jgi:hypothetical protein
MIKTLIDCFDHNIIHCIVETNDEVIEVFDCYDCTPAEQRSYIRTNENAPIHFVLNNPNAARIVFAALDNCIFKPHEQSRCDFMIGNFQKLYFVEIKQVKARQRQEARYDAIRQLHSSISFFKERIDLADTNIYAVISLKAKLSYPLQNAKRVNDAVAFKESYNAILMEGQSHTF